MEYLIIVIPAFFIIAALYSSVGHAGATGYLAIMALMAFSPEEIKPTALMLNIFVASIGSFRYLWAGYFNNKLFLWVSLFSFPAAFVSGYIVLDETIFLYIAGSYLTISALLLLHKVLSQKPNHLPSRPFHKPTAAITGTTIGFFSGLIGMGGGVFLSPILLLLRWSNAKETSGVTSMFILVNSLLGLAGYTASGNYTLQIHWWLLVPVILGGITGSFLGSRVFKPRTIYIILIIILLSSGIKMISGM